VGEVTCIPIGHPISIKRKEKATKLAKVSVILSEIVTKVKEGKDMLPHGGRSGLRGAKQFVDTQL